MHSANNDFIASTTAAAYLATDAPGLFNGNISHMVSTITNPTNSTTLPQLTAYRYDQLNRIRAMKAYRDITANAWGDGTGYDGSYQTNVSYDANGNITGMRRFGRLVTADPMVPKEMDDLAYVYENIANGYSKNTNKLRHVNDNPAYTNNYQTDIDNQGVFLMGVTENYSYDQIGNLTKDVQEKIDNIDWTVYGKVKKITRTPLLPFENGQIEMTFAYDAQGNRVRKSVKNQIGGGSAITNSHTYYVRDASGNIMATYEHFQANTSYLKLKEHHVYGSSRIGVTRPDQLLWTNVGGVTPPDNTIKRTLGKKFYELTEHRNNVNVSILDKKLPVEDVGGVPGTIAYYLADIQSAVDYGVWGDELPGRSFFSENARFGFNGKEKDDEIKGNGNSIDYGARIYDPRLGRWLAVDPKASAQAGITPFAYTNNMPVFGIDQDGEICIPCIIILAGFLTAPSVGVTPTGSSGDRIAVQNAYDLQARWILLSVAAGGAANGALGSEFINEIKNQAAIQFFGNTGIEIYKAQKEDRSINIMDNIIMQSIAGIDIFDASLSKLNLSKFQSIIASSVIDLTAEEASALGLGKDAMSVGVDLVFNSLAELSGTGISKTKFSNLTKNLLSKTDQAIQGKLNDELKKQLGEEDYNRIMENMKNDSSLEIKNIEAEPDETKVKINCRDCDE